MRMAGKGLLLTCKKHDQYALSIFHRKTDYTVKYLQNLAGDELSGRVPYLHM